MDQKLLVGAMMFAMNVGTRHVVEELTPLQHKVMATTIAKRFVMFAIFYMAVRDIVCAFVLTGVFSLGLSTLFNESSDYYLFEDSLTSLRTL